MRLLLASVMPLEGLANGLLAVRNDLELTTLGPRRVDLGGFQQGLTDLPPPRPYRAVQLPVWPVWPYTYSCYHPAVGRLLRETRPDVVFAFGEPSELGVAQLVALTRGLVPTAAVMLYTFENVDRDWWACPRCLRGLAEARTLPQVEAIACASRLARERLRRLGYPPERVTILPPAIDLTVFGRVPAGDLAAELGRGELLVGFIGRLVPLKGLDTVLAAVARVAGVRLAIVGDGADRPRLERLAGELGVAERVTFVGPAPFAEVARYHSAFDALLLPSRSTRECREQFGMVLAEAMACGTPVVGSSSGAIPEVVGDAGLIFPEGDIEALARCLSLLRDDPARRAELARRARRRAERRYTMPGLAKGLLRVMDEAVARRARARR